jgi:hypothetical protein
MPVGSPGVQPPPSRPDWRRGGVRGMDPVDAADSGPAQGARPAPVASRPGPGTSVRLAAVCR